MDWPGGFPPGQPSFQWACKTQTTLDGNSIDFGENNHTNDGDLMTTSRHRFFCPEGEARSFAEMSLEEKNTMSHRARAFAKMIEYLKTSV